jgi:ATP-dependent Zn protease
MAKEANVPFLFVSATAFQSMWYGMTARRIRAFFRALRKAAAEEGGAIGFIEEIDAIGMKRGGPSAPNSLVRFSDVDAVVGMDSGGIVNELLVQMQSFDEPTRAERIKGWFKDRLNRFLPPHRQLRKHPAPYSNILVIGATNRAVALDPALLRPGRFDRILHFDLPGRTARRELIDYFLARKAHAPEMDTDRHRDDLASATLGYSPASLERLFDEALLLALRDNRRALAAADLRRARVEIEIGLPEPVDSPAAELATIATHEAGHAVMAYLVGKGRKLEMLSIIKRREALGFLAHRMTEERHTLKASEIVAQIQIALGGLVAEEMYFGESSTGPAGDLAAATNLGVEMVGSMGLGGSLISFRALDQGAFGGNMAAKVLADQEARAAVAKLLEDNKGVVEKVLSSHRHLIEALRDALIERHELMDNEILDVIVGAEGRPNVVIDLRDEALVG